MKIRIYNHTKIYAKKQEGWAKWLRRTVSEIKSFAVIFGSVSTTAYSCHTSAHNLGMKIGNCRTSTDDQNPERSRGVADGRDIGRA